MTDTADRLEQALSMIDANLSGLQSREVVSAAQMSDLLLDLRLLLMELDPNDAPVMSS